MLKKLPEPVGNENVLNTVADPSKIQVLYLWEDGNVPAVTEFTADMTGYFDEYDFRPYVTAIPVLEGVKPKGAVVLMAGGAYQFRGNYTDSLPPTFYVYGTEDPFYRQFRQQYDVIKGMGIPTGRIMLDGWTHGFGSDGGWIRDYAAWLETIFE